MAVLTEALLLCTDGPLLVQALAAWLAFVRLLAEHAPAVLGRIAAQAAVVLLPVLEPASSSCPDSSASFGSSSGSGSSSAAAVQLAADVLHEIVVKQRGAVRAALVSMPPLPPLEVLREVNSVLAQVGVYACMHAAPVCMHTPMHIHMHALPYAHFPARW
jgi:hypothetical protein